MKSILLLICIVLFFNHFLVAQSSFINVIDFDGDGDYASTINEPVFPIGNGTIEVWMKVRSITPGVIGDAFFAKNEEQWNEGDFYMWFESVSGKLKASIQSPPSQPPIHTDVQSNISFWNYYEIWFHTAFTWGNSGMKLYINGVLQSVQSSVTHTAMNNSINFYIGTHGYKLHSGNYNIKDFFDGQIDEVRIWNYQKTSEQIISIWGEPLDSTYYSSIDSGLVGYWKFDELEDLGINNDGVDDVRDYSVLHNHIDLAGDAHLVPADIIVPVEFVSFTANLNKQGYVALNWETATEINNLGFKVQKSYNNEEFFTIGFVEGSGTTTEPKAYYFKDENSENGVNYYRLKQLDYNGTYEYSEVLEINVNIISNYLLHQNYPNPFNPSTIIKFQIPELSFVTLKIYDVLGNEMASLINEEKPAGNFKVEFNASALSSGIYYYKLSVGSFAQSRKMVLLR
jgi:hypothetical protein